MTRTGEMEIKLSEHQPLDDDQPRLHTGYIERNGTYMQFKDKWWDKKEGEPKLITVCKFPGN